MSIEGSAILVDGTISTSGGTSTDLALTGGPSLSEMLLYLDDSSEPLNQQTLLFSIVRARVLASAPNGYTQRRSKIVYQRPKVLANGNRTTDQASVNIGVDVETTAAEVATMVGNLAQLLSAASFADFWANQRLE
jgi:hypothetical protein